MNCRARGLKNFNLDGSIVMTKSNLLSCAIATAVAACMFSASAWATQGNNGNGNGGCGVGQQTNGCSTPVPGPAGPQGPQGEPGPKGDTGAQGPKGDAGATGAAGADGKNGSNGSNGADGAAGKDGVQGVAGAPGANAPNAVTQDQLDAVARRNNAGIASAIAVGFIPQSPEAGGKMVGAAVSTYGSEQAMALGVSYLSQNKAWVSKAGVSVGTRGSVGAAVAVGFTWK